MNKILDEEYALDMYGFSPLFEPISIVHCKHCSKPIKQSHAKSHLFKCLFAMKESDRRESLARHCNLTQLDQQNLALSCLQPSSEIVRPSRPSIVDDISSVRNVPPPPPLEVKTPLEAKVQAPDLGDQDTNQPSSSRIDNNVVVSTEEENPTPPEDLPVVVVVATPPSSMDIMSATIPMIGPLATSYERRKRKLRGWTQQIIQGPSQYRPNLALRTSMQPASTVLDGADVPMVVGQSSSSMGSQARSSSPLMSQTLLASKQTSGEGGKTGETDSPSSIPALSVAPTSVNTTNTSSTMASSSKSTMASKNTNHAATTTPGSGNKPQPPRTQSLLSKGLPSSSRTMMVGKYQHQKSAQGSAKYAEVMKNMKHSNGASISPFPAVTTSTSPRKRGPESASTSGMIPRTTTTNTIPSPSPPPPITGHSNNTNNASGPPLTCVQTSSGVGLSPATTKTNKNSSVTITSSGIVYDHASVANRIGMIRAQLTKATQKAQAEALAKSMARSMHASAKLNKSKAAAMKKVTATLKKSSPTTCSATVDSLIQRYSLEKYHHPPSSSGGSSSTTTSSSSSSSTATSTSLIPGPVMSTASSLAAATVTKTSLSSKPSNDTGTEF